MARYVKTSMFLQSPEIEHHTPNHSYVIFPHWERKEPELELELRNTGVILYIPTLTYLLLWIWLLLHPLQSEDKYSGRVCREVVGIIGDYENMDVFI